MKRGEIVRVRLYGGEIVLRRVWEDAGSGLLLCTEEAYRHALETGEEPICVGFPRQDVEAVRTAAV